MSPTKGITRGKKMQIEMTPSQKCIIRQFMEIKAASSTQQADKFRVDAIASAAIVEKIDAASYEFNEEEIRSLNDLIKSLEIMRKMAPGIFTEEAVSALTELSPQIEAAKRKFDN